MGAQRNKGKYSSSNDRKNKKRNQKVMTSFIRLEPLEAVKYTAEADDQKQPAGKTDFWATPCSHSHL